MDQPTLSGCATTLRTTLAQLGLRAADREGVGQITVTSERHDEVEVCALRLLVVDDTEDMRMLLRMGFRADARFDVIGEAIDGVDAIEQAKAKRPDAILLDIAMPRMDGIEALPFLRNVVPNARIVAFSANPNYAAPALAAGADCFIEKGVAREAIAAALLADGSPGD